jgi:hypothetical protein
MPSRISRSWSGTEPRTIPVRRGGFASQEATEYTPTPAIAAVRVTDPIIPRARARQATCNWVASTHAIARGLGGDVRAVEVCCTPLSVCHPVCISAPPLPATLPEAVPPGPPCGASLLHPAPPVQHPPKSRGAVLRLAAGRSGGAVAPRWGAGKCPECAAPPAGAVAAPVGRSREQCCKLPRSMSHILERVQSGGGAGSLLAGTRLIACKDASLFQAFSCPWPPSSIFYKLLEIERA